MKKPIENKYIKIGLTALLVIAASILFYFLLLRVDGIFKIIGKILFIFKPVIYGLVIAFLLTLTFNFFEKKFNKMFMKKMKDDVKAKKLAKALSIALSILILLVVLFLIFYVLIPKLIVSALGILETLPENIKNLEKWLEGILKSNSTLENFILSAINDSSKSILLWISEGVLPKMENISSSVTTGITDIYVFLKDFIIGIVFSIYIVANKSKFSGQSKKIMYTIIGVKKGNALLQGARYSYKVFNGFIRGKLLTSLIIGVACYLGMIIFKMPYALIISFIITVTNIIPFFGPIIGWIPSVILIALINPMLALYFTIFIIILQQIEGNILEPKILGNTTGISGFWVLFAIVLFGGLFGFWGMIIGVPIFAIIYHFASFYLKKKLADKGLPTETTDYANLKYIDETTKKPVKKRSSI